MNPKTLTLLVWGIISMFATASIADPSFALNDPRLPSLTLDFDECVAFTGGSQFDYAEFTAKENNFSQCSQIQLSNPPNVFRSNVAGNAHSCAPGIANSRAMCIDGSPNCTYNPNSIKALKFNVNVTPGPSGIGTLDKVSFYEQAPEIYTVNLGEQGLNNYPQLMTVRVLANGQEIYRSDALATQRNWNITQLDFTDETGFQVTQSTTFNFEILPYCPVGNGGKRIIWDIDQLEIIGNCNSIYSGTISTNDITNICANTNTGGVVNVSVASAFGPLRTLVVTDELGMIVQLPAGQSVDFRTFSNGIYNISHIVYEPGIIGLNIGNNISRLNGCFDLSNSINVNNNVLTGGNIVFDTGFFDAYICGDDFASNQVTTQLSNAGGRFTTYILLDNNNTIIQTFQGPGFDFTNLPTGSYNIVAATHNGQFHNSVVGAQLSDLAGCFALSNNLRVIKDTLQVGTISINGQSQLTLCRATTMSITLDVTGPVSNTIRYVAVGSTGRILNIYDNLPINISNFIEERIEIRQISFFGRLTNFQVDQLLSDVRGCFLLSNPVIITNVQVEGGQIITDDNLTAIEVCIDDGQQENIVVNLSGNEGAQSDFLILDSNGNILNITDDNIFNFERVPPGNCRIVHISYQGMITGLQNGMNVSDIEGCIDLSNPITVTRLERFDCEGGCNVASGTLIIDRNTLCRGVATDDIISGSVTGAIGNVQQVIVTDNTGIVLTIANNFPIDLNQYENGNYMIYALSSFDDTRISVGDNIADIDHDCFDLSTATALRIAENIAGAVSLSDGSTDISICVGDTLSDVLNFANTGSSINYIYAITDSVGVVLQLSDTDNFDFNDSPIGRCNVYGIAFSDSVLLNPGDNITSLTSVNGCVELSSNFITIRRFDNGVICGEIICEAEGGVITIDNNSFCVGDGIEDLVIGQVTDAVGSFMQILVTDSDSIIISLPDGFPFDVESAGAGTCLIWNLASTSNIPLVTGLQISEIQDSCFALSESVSFTRTVNFGGVVTLPGSTTSIEICVGDMTPDTLQFLTTGIGMNYQYIITDTSDVILGLPVGDMVDFNSIAPGICRVYGIAHNALYTQSVGDTLSLPTFQGRCFDFSSNFIQVNRLDEGIICGETECLAFGGVLSISNSQFCVGDGEPDLLDVNVVGALGDTLQVIITDLDSNIVLLPEALPIDIDAFDAGSCIVWNLSTTDTLDISVGDNINDVQLECFSFSEPVTFNRIENFGGNVSLIDNVTSIELCVSDTISDLLTFLTTGIGMNYQFVITDDNDTIISLPIGDNFDFTNVPSGTCRVYGLASQLPLELLMGQELVELNDFNNCIDLSNNFIEIIRSDTGIICGEMECDVNGGIVELDNTLFCVGDGEEDLVTGRVVGSAGGSMQLIVTDADSIVLGLPSGFPIDVEGSGPGGCIIWNLASQTDIELLPGMSINTIQDSCFSLSSGAAITRLENNGGSVSLENGDMTQTICVGDSVSDSLTFINTGVGEMYTYFVTDTNDVIISIPLSDNFDFEDAGVGICRVWGVAHNSLLSYQVGDTLIEIDFSAACLDLSDNFIEINRADDDTACTACSAQVNNCTGTEVGLIFDDAVATSDSSICMALKVTNFTDIVTFQGGMMWDPDDLMFTGTQSYGLPGMSATGSFNIDTLGGTASYVWFDNSGGANAQTFADSTTIFEICFDVIGDIGDNSLIKVLDLPNNIIQVSSQSGVLDYCQDDGCITIIEGSDLIFTLIAEDIVTMEDTVCVDVTVDNFSDIMGMQFAMQWDTTFMCFDTVVNNNTSIGIFQGAFFEDEDILRLTWNNNPTTVADGTLLFTVCFDIKDNNCDSSSFFNFVDDITLIEIVSGSTSIPFALENGSVTLECMEPVITQGEEIIYSISPNPSDNLLSVRLEQMPDEEYTIYIHNSYGQNIYTERYKGDEGLVELDISQYPDGILYMTISAENKIKTQKFIVLHK